MVIQVALYVTEIRKIKILSFNFFQSKNSFLIKYTCCIPLARAQCRGDHSRVGLEIFDWFKSYHIIL